MNRKELALQLGISGAMVTKLAKRGMPTEDAEKARRWRKRNLQTLRTKGVRIDTWTGQDAIGNVSTAGSVSAQLHQPAVDRVRDLSLVAFAALQGGTFEIIAPLLREALQAVPAAARPCVQMPIEVWDALTQSIPGGGGGGPNDFSDEFMETFWYQIALGPQLTDHVIVQRLVPAARNARNTGTGEA